MREQLASTFMAAVRLLNINNNYWATTKYDQLNRLIETTRTMATSWQKQV